MLVINNEHHWKGSAVAKILSQTKTKCGKPITHLYEKRRLERDEKGKVVDPPKTVKIEKKVNLSLRLDSSLSPFHSKLKGSKSSLH